MPDDDVPSTDRGRPDGASDAADDDDEAGRADEPGEGRGRRGPGPRPWRRGRWSRRWATTWGPRAKVALFALGGAVVALALAGRVPAEVGPFETTVAARPSWTGETVVRLAPLGTIELDTHDWPLRLDLRVDQLSLDEAERIADDPTLVDRLGDDLADEVRNALVHLAVRCALLALAGGAVGALLARASWRSAAAGVGAGALVVATATAGTAATFDAGAVAEPRYTGVLTVAPTAVGDVEAIVERFGEYRAQLSDLVGNIVTLYRAAEGLPTFEPDDDLVRVLHVSDVHLNPQAFDLMRQLTDQFGVEAILDTGDLTDWGTGTEELIVEEIGRLDVPYVFVRGNHDSRAIERAVADQPNATVLDGEAAEVAGLRIWGIGDPRYTPDKQEADDTDSERERAEEFAPRAARSLVRSEPPDVDVALVHDPRAAADLGGLVPLVLAGHTHAYDESRLGDDTVLIAQGSTGGAGLRGLQQEEPKPLTASVMYFDPETARLVAYDVVSVEGLGGTGATITRHVLPEPPERDRSGPSRAAESVGRAGAPAATASTDDTPDDTTGATTATTSG